MNDSLGDRIKKNYESRAYHYLTRRVPVVIRVDGRAFHTYTRGLKKPFDRLFMDAMVTAAHRVYAEMQGCKMAYVQSDEASFVLTDYDDLETQAWFDYRQNKLESIAGALMSVAFHEATCGLNYGDLAVFDARAFNVPEAEVANYFLWRAQDWQRNSVQMLAQSVYSHCELQDKSLRQCHKMLADKNHDWASQPANVRCGTYIVSPGVEYSVQARYTEIAKLWEEVNPKT